MRPQRTIPRPERDGAAYKATCNAVALLDARIISHGAEALPAWLAAAAAGWNRTDCAAVMLRIRRENFPDVLWRACAEVLR